MEGVTQKITKFTDRINFISALNLRKSETLTFGFAQLNGISSELIHKLIAQLLKKHDLVGSGAKASSV